MIPKELRTEVARRANGRCEYCLIHEADSGFPHQIDHIISRKHRGESASNNLAYACVLCNRYKGSDIAAMDRHTGKIAAIFHPRLDRWSDHFRLEGAMIEPTTSIGAATVQLLRLNASERISERQLLQRLGRYPSSKCA